MFPEAKPRGTSRVEGKQNSLFPVGPVIECFIIPPSSKMEQFNYIRSAMTAKKITFLMPAGTQICRGFKVHDLITCESKVHFVVSLGSYN